MRIALTQIKDGAQACDITGMVACAEDKGADALLLNELPFGRWQAHQRSFDPAAAARWVAQHETALDALAATSTLTFFGSRPCFGSTRLINEAFSRRRGRYKARHQKRILPNENGWRERTWFEAGNTASRAFQIDGVRFAYLVCSELMFTEASRILRDQHVDVILAPRATSGPLNHWLTAARMAAIWSGCYVLSCNRSGGALNFSGNSFAINPAGDLIIVTNAANPVAVVEIKREHVAQNRKRFPAGLVEPRPASVRLANPCEMPCCKSDLVDFHLNNLKSGTKEHTHEPPVL